MPPGGPPGGNDRLAQGYCMKGGGIALLDGRSGGQIQGVYKLPGTGAVSADGSINGVEEISDD